MRAVSGAIKAKGLAHIFKNLRKVLADSVGKKWSQNYGKTLKGIGTRAEVGSSAVAGNPQTTIATNPDVTNVHHTVKGLFLGKNV